MRTGISVVLALAVSSGVVVQGQQAPAPAPAGGQSAAAPPAATTPRADANGNPLRTAKTGHVSNYDEAKVAPYTLPDPLILPADAGPRRGTWTASVVPRSCVVQTEIFGRVPSNAPKVTWDVKETDPAARRRRGVDEGDRRHRGQRPNAGTSG